MNAPLGIVAGLGSALACGVGDFLAQGATRRHGWLRAMFGLHAASLPLLLAAALVERGLPGLDAAVLARLAALAICNTVGAAGLYRGLEVGRVSVVSPIASSFGAVTVLCAVVAGDPPPVSSLPGLAAVVVGVALASVVRERGRGDEASERRFRRGAGVGWALLASLGFGVAFFGLGEAVAALGPIWPIVGLRVVSVPLLLVALRVRRTERARPTGGWGRILAIAAFDSAGLILYATGLAFGHVGVVAVLSSLFAAVTVVLALAVLRERAEPWQWAGIALLLAGVAWISAVSS